MSVESEALGELRNVSEQLRLLTVGIKCLKTQVGELENSVSEIRALAKSLEGNDQVLIQKVEEANLSKQQVRDRYDFTIEEVKKTRTDSAEAAKLSREAVQKVNQALTSLEAVEKNSKEGFGTCLERIQRFETEVGTRVFEIKEFVEKECLTYEEYKDDQQNAEIEEYRNWKRKILAFIQRFGIPIGIGATMLVNRLISDGTLTEISQFLVDLFTDE